MAIAAAAAAVDEGSAMVLGAPVGHASAAFWCNAFAAE
jgi:hypothetical protein